MDGHTTTEGQGPTLATRLVSALRDAGAPTRPVVFDDEGSWTVDDLAQAVNRAAGALRSSGAGRGEPILVAVPPGRTWLQAVLAVTTIGAVAVPVDPVESAPRIRRLRRTIRCTRAIGERDDLGSVTLVGSMLDDGVPAQGIEVDPQECAVVLQTSGSTGDPKGVMHSHSRCALPGYLGAAIGCGPHDRVASASAGFSALGLFIGILRPLACGAAVVMSARKPTVRSVLGMVEDGEVTVLSAVPTFWAQLATYLERRPSERDRLHSLRAAIASGEPLHAGIVERFQLHAGMRLVNGFGSAECGDIVLGTHDPASRGLGVPTAEIDVRRGRDGRLMVRCPTATIGYLGRPADTASLIRDAWLRTGDLVSIAQDGCHHHGRSDGAVKVAGRLLHPAAAEACLYEHPAVVEAAVVTTCDERRSQRAGAFVAVREPMRPDIDDQLRRLLAERFGTQGGRARLTFVPALPKLGSGKIDRQLLARTLVA